MSEYTNEEYVERLKLRNALPFVEDCRTTLAEIFNTIARQQGVDETPRAYWGRISRAKTDLTRLMLRIQDGNTP